jgi:membrane protein implicated in regulation of membrane protease activity
MKTMKPHFKTFPHFHVLVQALLAAVAVLALSTAQMTASDKKSVPASILSKLDDQLVLVVKKSRGEAPFDTATTLQPDVFSFGGRVLVEIEGSFSRALSDQIASLGGQVVIGWGTTTTFRAWVPFAQLETLAGRADIRFISAARPSITHRISPR